MRLGMISIRDVYDSIHALLREDPEILSMLGLTSTASLEVLETRIQKRKYPRDLVQDHLPLIAYYKKTGSRGSNYLEYRFVIEFKIYTQDNVGLAIDIADRITRLFDGKWISGLTRGSVFKGEFVASAEDADIELDNSYKFLTQIAFSIGVGEN